MNDASENTIPSAIESLLDLFRTDLREVRFPGVDSESLLSSAEEVRAAADVVATAEQSLTLALRVLAERQDGLLQKSQRALAYVRIYAEEDADLMSRLDAVQLARPGRGPVNTEPAPAKQRGRPRKASGSDPTERLFQVGDASASVSASALS